MDPRDFEDIPEWQRHLILIGAAMGSSTRGLQQIANKVGLKSKTFGTSDEDMKGIDFNKKAVDDLADKTRGGVLSSLFGSLADPVGLLAGGALGKAAGIGSKLLAPTKSGARALAEATAGGAAQGLVAEERENENRFSNALTSGLMSAAAKPAGNAVKKIWGGANENLSKQQSEFMGDALARFRKTGRWTDDVADLDEQGKNIGMFRGYTDPITGMWANPWRAFIDTSDAKLKKAGDTSFGTNLFDVLDSPSLQNAAPYLKNARLGLLSAKGQNPHASVSGMHITSFADNEADHIDNIRHEVGHIIQRANDWPKGSDPVRLKELLEGEVTKARTPNKAGLAYLMTPGEIEVRDGAARYYATSGDKTKGYLDRFGPYALNLSYKPNEGLAQYFAIASPHPQLGAMHPLNSPFRIKDFPMYTGMIPENFKGDYLTYRRLQSGKPILDLDDLE